MAIITVPKRIENTQSPEVNIGRWIILNRNHTRSEFRSDYSIASNSFKNAGKSYQAAIIYLPNPYTWMKTQYFPSDIWAVVV